MTSVYYAKSISLSIVYSIIYTTTDRLFFFSFLIVTYFFSLVHRRSTSGSFWWWTATIRVQVMQTKTQYRLLFKVELLVEALAEKTILSSEFEPRFNYLRQASRVKSVVRLVCSTLTLVSSTLTLLSFILLISYILLTD